MADPAPVVAAPTPAPVVAPAPAPIDVPPTIVADPAPAPVVPAKGYWPEDWRTKVGSDIADEKERAKELKLLERYTDPAAVWKKARALEIKLSSGEYASKLGKDATAEEVTQWRKDNGIPEKPEGYELKLADGRVIGEADKPQINAFLTRMHAMNAPPGVVSAAADAYYEAQEQAIAQREDADAKIKQTNEDALRVEWGADFRRNINLVKGLFASAPEGFAEKMFNARFADGTPVGSDLAALKHFANMARELNPAGAVVPGAGTNAGAAIADEKAKIEKMMEDPSSEYYKSDAMRARYRELIDVSAKMAKAA